MMLTAYGLWPNVQDRERLEETGGNLRQLSSTHGSGGVLEIFYPHWKLKVRD
jgi:hypothetical protein